MVSLICPVSDITLLTGHQEREGTAGAGKVKSWENSQDQEDLVHQGHGGAAGPRRGDGGDPAEETLAEGELSQRLAVGAGHRLHDR